MMPWGSWNNRIASSSPESVVILVAAVRLSNHLFSPRYVLTTIGMTRVWNPYLDEPVDPAGQSLGGA
jgi:hypothetical protein